MCRKTQLTHSLTHFTDPAKRKGAYALIQSAIGLQTSSSSAASTVASPQSPEDMEEEEGNLFLA